MRTLNTQEFIRRAKAKHGDTYDYSKTIYTGAVNNVTIICRVHGEFLQCASNHIHLGQGCPKCKGVKQAARNAHAFSQFLKKAREVHGNKYQYDKSSYKGMSKDIRIICPNHGIFEQRANHHTNGSGCRECAKLLQGPKKLTNEEFIGRAKEVHGDKFDYSLVDYKGVDIDVAIICLDHGVFEQSANNHIWNKAGCPICAGNKQITQDGFVLRAKEIHGDKYDYGLTKYKKMKERVKIVCPIHGEFVQIASNHLLGKGCQKCGYSSSKLTQLKSQDKFITQAKEIHGDKYDYSLVDYKGQNEPITLICKEHGEFIAFPKSHLSKKVGCQYCSNKGFNKDKPATLYYLRVETRVAKAYKIGITNRTVDERYKMGFEADKIEVIKEWYFEKGIDARRREMEIKIFYKDDLYKGEPLLEYGGNTELFSRDILGLDNC